MDRFVYRERKNLNTEKNYVSFGSLFNNTFARLVLLAVSVFLLYNVAHSIKITIQKVDILKDAREEVDGLRLKNLELALSLNSMQTEEYLEVQARDRLNFSGEGEYIFVIPDDMLKEAEGRVDDILSGTIEVESVSIYEEWKEFLLRGI